MLYGSFETFVTELVIDGLTAQNEANVFDNALRLMVLRRWQGKMDLMDHRLEVGLGRRQFVRWFKDIDMGFLGVPCPDPLDFLEKASDLRHRLVHYSGKADSKLVNDYPQSGLTVGQNITLPLEQPFDIQVFFADLSD